jgi:RND family efflux transporter MFP subunit
MIEQLEAPETEQVKPPERPAAKKAGWVRWVGVAAFLMALAAASALPRIEREKQAIAAVNESAVLHPVVTTVQPAKGEAVSELVLPGNIQPLYIAAMYARANGYLQERSVDIGSHVNAGQVLAVIASPEIDQQLLQARGTLAQAEAGLRQVRAALDQSKANVELARLTRDRNLPLGEQRAISQQIVDEAVQNYHARAADVEAASANIAVAEANVAANRANVARLEQMQSFEKVVAPFDGVITERNVERGDLVATGNNETGKPLFGIAQSGTLRVQVDVPQSEAVNIRAGQKAHVEVKERLGRTYTGTVVRTAGSLDDAARTMLTEVQVDNRDGSLLPGMYAQVKFALPGMHTSLVIPTSALVVDHSGMRVVTVSKEGRIHFVPVLIGRDMGIRVEILQGIQASDRLVASPGDLLNEGQMVEVR